MKFRLRQRRRCGRAEDEFDIQAKKRRNNYKFKVPPPPARRATRLPAGAQATPQPAINAAAATPARRGHDPREPPRTAAVSDTGTSERKLRIAPNTAAA
ncbi:hypothetical protein EVAR_54737_1 [Eumeta japonica]|uniref:Uncharacterized protein n=1 Tax=Eumeta variegata TaxID=151549 RepID=A0A4C1Z0G4_EUMVA|nr:hypothetical protein EVAR_54737_1 [Eumeta japonica]